MAGVAEDVEAEILRCEAMNSGNFDRAGAVLGLYDMRNVAAVCINV
jgi:hypothetical protein